MYFKNIQVLSLQKGTMHERKQVIIGTYASIILSNFLVIVLGLCLISISTKIVSFTMVLYEKTMKC